jgi:hypothetical protein
VLSRLTAEELGAVETALLQRGVLAGSGPVEAIEGAPDGAVDWARLLEAADRHRLVPLLAQGALAAGGAFRRAPVGALERLRNGANLEMARAVVRLHHVDELAVAGLVENLDACLLKGAAFATTLYANPALRPMTDIDVLVPASSFERWTETLGSMGYIPLDRSDHAVCLRRRQTGVLVELHRELTSQSPVLGLPTEEVLERAVPLAPGEGSRLRTLSWEDHLVHLSLHASFQHGFRQPGVNAWDARCIAERADFDATLFLERSRHAGILPWVYGGLALSETVFPGERIRDLRSALESELPRRLVRKARRFRAERLLAPGPEAVLGAPFERLGWTGPSLQALLVLLDLSRPRRHQARTRPHRILQLVRDHGIAALRAAFLPKAFLAPSPTPASLGEVRDV